MNSRLLVRVLTSPTTTEAAVRGTCTSIERSARALRKVGIAVDVAVTPDAIWESGVSQSPAPDFVATCVAGTAFDPNFLSLATHRLLREPDTVAVADRLIYRGRPDQLHPVVDSSAATRTLVQLLEHNPWPGPRVMRSALYEGAGEPRPDWGGVLALIALRAAFVTVPSINVQPNGYDDTRGRLSAALITSIAAGLERPASHSAPRVRPWEDRHPVISGPIRVARRGRRGIARRAHAVAARIEEELAQRRAARVAAVDVSGIRATQSIAVDAVQRTGEYGRLLGDAWDGLGRAADIVLVTTQVSSRSSDQAALLHAQALLAQSDGATAIAVVTTGRPEETDSGLLPLEVRHVRVADGFAVLTPTQRAELMIELSAVSGARTLAVIDDPSLAPDACAAAPRTLPHVQIHLTGVASTTTPTVDTLATIVTNGPEEARHLLNTGAAPDRLAICVDPPLPTMAEFETVTQYTAAYDDVEFDAEHPFRLLWRTSDADASWRAESLTELAEELARRGLPVRVQLHHEVGTAPPPASPASRGAIVDDGGVFTGGALTLPTENYHAMVFDVGMRDARRFCLQAMLLGLPIVATHRASDLIIPDVTAIIPPTDDSAAVADVLDDLIRSRVLRRQIIRSAYNAARRLIDAGGPQEQPRPTDPESR